MPRKSDSLSTEIGMGRKICFVSLASYPVLAEKNMGYTGGAEVHQVLLAKELVKHNFEVSFVTYGDEQAPIEYLDDIKVIKVYKREAASNLTLFSKAWCIWKTMRQANADIYFHEAGAYGVVPIFCSLKRKKFTYNIALDWQVSKESALIYRKFYYRLGIKVDIKLADVIIAQNEFQRKMLKENFGRESLIIKPAFPIPTHELPEKASPPIILWVATIGDHKQPELFLKLAEAIPGARFQMIGGPGTSPELYNKVKESAAKIPNLEFLGFVPEVDRYFTQASIFVNTSKVEGFPSTFIQAWLQYVPTVSLIIDPDEVIDINRLGFHSRTFNQLIYDIELLLKDGELRKQMGKNARKYAEKEHDIKEVVKKYIEVFNRLLKTTKARL